MKVKVLKDGEYAMSSSSYKDVFIAAGTEFITSDYQQIGSHMRYFVSHNGKTVTLYQDEVHATPDDVSDKIAMMRKVKLDRLNKHKALVDKLPGLNDVVLYTRSKKNGDVIGAHQGIVVDITYVNAFHVWIKVQESSTGEFHELIIGHPQGWYGGDKVETVEQEKPVGDEEPIEDGEADAKSYQYFGIHDGREDKIRLDSLHVHREDTENYLRSLVGEPAPSYMKVRKLKIQFDD